MDTTAEHVILVNDDDVAIGTMEKLAAHRAGDLHRAFSVLISDSHGRLLLQQRYIGKYHSGGLWTNACCGHPQPGEDVAAAAQRRLEEEMGFVTPLAAIGTFRYRADVGDGLCEHELVHLFAGTYDGPLRPNPRECDGYTWMTDTDVARDCAREPERFTAWFKLYVVAGWPLKRAHFCGGK